ncbi:MAG: hypothetical protein J7M21_04220 [Planctomycetes bacterium]|nr:hypothetical protein [Planctomycetota bacterium]
MRTDMKIGVAVGLLIIIAVGTYYAVFDRGSPADANQQGGKQLAQTGDAGGGEPAAACSPAGPPVPS